MAPTRNVAYILTHLLLKVAPREHAEQVEFKKRFEEDYGPLEMTEEDRVAAENKGPEWSAQFEGNHDDNFLLGLNFSRRCFKMYADFYKSDIIVASPLGLKRVIGESLEAKERKQQKALQAGKMNQRSSKGDSDFLSSIEMVIVDSCDVLHMQNWDHLNLVFEHLNLLPKEAHDTDFSRVRPWCLDGQAKHFRQTVLFSAFKTAEQNSLFSRYCWNRMGTLRLTSTDPLVARGSITRVIPKVKQMFQKIGECPSSVGLDDARFAFFSQRVYPRLKSTNQTRTIIFIPSYFDYVRVRNLFDTEEYGKLSIGLICEYSERKEVAQHRLDFITGRISFLLVTERFYFFNRYLIKGAHHVILYSLPLYPSTYSGVLNWLPSQEQATALILYCLPFDQFQLEGVVGSKRALQMAESTRDTHVIV